MKKIKQAYAFALCFLLYLHKSRKSECLIHYFRKVKI